MALEAKPTVNLPSGRDVSSRVKRQTLPPDPNPFTGASLRLEFRPHVELIKTARELVTQFYGQLFLNADAISRVALATHELLENIVKYASEGPCNFESELVVDRVDSAVRIRAQNRTTPERANNLVRLVAEIGANAHPLQMYQHFMRRSALRKDGGSGLGLARIRAEAEMTVCCDVREDEITIVVEGPVGMAGRS